MNSTFLMIIVVLLIVLTIVVAYNLYQENQYRKKIRSQFAHADQDALMNSKMQSVRDGQHFGTINEQNKAPLHITGQVASSTHASSTQAELPKQDNAFILVDEPNQQMNHSIAPQTDADNRLDGTQENVTVTTEKATLAPEKPLLIELNDLERNQLLWFDKRFDYMGYVALHQPKELTALPRLSSGHHFQIIGCTMDGRFQVAEPIPGVLYQAFIIGLQGISRKGLATTEELTHFAQQIQLFAEKMDGKASVTDIDTFLQIAQPLDELCARVDQTIAIHLVGQEGSTVSGIELKTALENAGFQLSLDGVFELMGTNGEVKYTIAALDGSPFTEALLASQPYKGLSMLFDITRVPDGENHFNEFMNLAVQLSSNLHFDLVDDQVRPLSIDWLKKVRSYVGERQTEMEKIGIAPASTLAKRLFS